MATTLNDAPAATLTEFDRGYYGWRVVMASSLGVMVGFGSLFVYTFSVFMKPLGAQFGWSREAISSGFGFAALSMAVCSPVLGHLLDRYGPRRVILPCSLIYGCRLRFVRIPPSASLAVLRHMYSSGGCGQRRRAPRLLARDLKLVSPPPGTGLRHGDGGSRIGVHDPSICCPNHHHAFRLAVLRICLWAGSPWALGSP